MAITSSSDNPAIAAFLERNHIAVLATADKQTAIPHATAIYYTTTSKLNFFFVTKKKTTKSRNLEFNPLASLVVYEAESQTTAQVYGAVKAIDDPVRLKTAIGIMAKFSQETAGTPDLPISKLKAGDYVLYELTPITIRLGSYRTGSKSHIFNAANVPIESLE